MNDFNFSINFNELLSNLTQQGIHLGLRILGAILIYIVGRLIIKWVNRLFAKILQRQSGDKSIHLFLRSFVNIALMVLLFLIIIAHLGFETTGLAALLASAGVAIGMALSGNLQNLAGGIIILIFRPYRVGDFIESATGASGTVKEIQIFHTVLISPDNKMIYVPNGTMSSNLVTNYSQQDTRRVEWDFSVEYGCNMEKVRQVTNEVILADQRILATPEPFIELAALADSSLDIKIRVWVKSADYWDVYFAMNRRIYEAYNANHIEFPFPQVTVHQA